MVIKGRGRGLTQSPSSTNYSGTNYDEIIKNNVIEAGTIFGCQFDGSDAQMPRVVGILAGILENIVAGNDLKYLIKDEGGDNYNAVEQVSVFHGLSAPSISVAKYLERIHMYAHCSPCCFVVAYTYLDRFTQRYPTIAVTSLTVHRLIITSLLVAAKFLDDEYYNNAYYAKIGGVSTHEMNRLELKFLFMLGFDLQVTTRAFHTYCCHLESQYFGNLIPAVDRRRSTRTASQPLIHRILMQDQKFKSNGHSNDNSNDLIKEKHYDDDDDEAQCPLRPGRYRIRYNLIPHDQSSHHLIVNNKSAVMPS